MCCEMCRVLVKFILFFVNLMFAIIGLLLFGVGIALIYYINDLTQEIPFSFDYVPYGAIGIGIVVFLIASCGCFGAIAEKKCPLITYVVFMGFFAAIKIAIIILLAIYLPDYTERVETEVNNAFEEPAHNVTFHGIEMLLQCCGTTGPDSYKTEHNLVPITCCKDPQNQTDIVCPKENAFETGCTTMVGEYFNSYMLYFGYGLIGMLVWELMAMAYSIYILQTRRSKI